MRRTDLGAWGAGLPRDEFDSALAAALVLTAKRPRTWRSQKPESYARRLAACMKNPGTPSGAMPALLEPSVVPKWSEAQTLAQAWAQAVDDAWAHPMRLELEGWRDHDPTWVLERLVLLQPTETDHQRLHGVYLHQPAPGASRAWHLPLCVGFLPDAESRELRAQMERRRYEWLTTLVELRSGYEACDLLLLPYSLPMGLARVLELRFRPDASCILVLDHEGGPFADALPLLLALQSQASSSALGLLDIPQASYVDWFNDLIEHLSHDEPLDVALWWSFWMKRWPVPLLLADSWFLAAARPSSVAERVLDRLVSRAPTGELMRVPNRWRYLLDTDGQGLTEDGMLSPAQFSRFRERVQEALCKHELVFDSERGDAMDVTELDHGVDGLAAPPPKESRHAQVRVQELGGPSGPIPEDCALVAGRDYAFDVRVAPPDPDWPGVREDFADKDIDFSRGPVELTIVFSEPSLCPEPLVDHMMLPATGASTACRFVVRAPVETRAFQARIAFVYRNRVLQTVLVSGQVVARAEDLADVKESTIERRVEALVGPGFDHLAGRRHFDAALVLNHAADGSRLAMALADERASWVSTEKFQKTVDVIRKMLTDMSLAIQDDEKLYASLSAPETNDLLLDLAINGAELYQGLVEDWRLDHLKSAERVQIIATDFDRFFPLEFFYDREVPDDDAKLCLTEPQALEEALREGRCDKACPKNVRKVICPLGFWCLRCVIERHTFDPNVVPKGRGDYALIPEGPTDGGVPLHPLHSAVFGASQKVDKKVKGQRDRVMATLKKLVRSETGRAETWGEWEETVGKVNPSLLLLIPHTVLERSKNAMEIGQQARLMGTRIRREHVRPSDTSPPPVVFLLGCDTGVDNLDFDSFVAGFRRARAALVVTTLSTVLGRHAAPIAQALLQELSDIGQAEPFGEATLAVRQKLFAQGMPAVLTLAVYGDADWLVEAEPS